MKQNHNKRLISIFLIILLSSFSFNQFQNSYASVSIEYLIVAGGGGGGDANLGEWGTGGGGGGEVKTGTISLAVGTYSVTVGAGGTALSVGDGNAGSASSVSSITSATGGLGGKKGSGANGGDGGNSGDGHTGGTGGAGKDGGGGAGDNANGGNGAVGVGGNGGSGTVSSISGGAVTYGGGGGGGCAGVSCTAGTGGAGGGGAGGAGAGNAVAGTANSGGGGGGGGATGGASGVGKDGGSGVVILRYLTGTTSATGGSITFAGGYTIHTFTTSGNFEIIGSPPDAVTDLTALNVGWYSAILNWTQPDMQGNTLSGYQINYTTPHNNTATTIKINNTGTSATSYTFTGFIYNTNYTIKIGVWTTEQGLKNMSGNILNITTYNPLLNSNLTTIGDTEKLYYTISSNPNGNIHLNLTNVKLIRNGTIVYSNSTNVNGSSWTTSIPLQWFRMSPNTVYNYTIQTISQTYNYLDITNTTSSFINDEYPPNYVHSSTIGGDANEYLNFTMTRNNPEQIIMTINRANTTGNWKAECNFLTGADYRDGGQWINQTNIQAYRNTHTTESSTVYIYCYNDELLFQIISYGNLTGLNVGLVGLENSLGTFFGLPLVFMFILFVASLYSGNRAGMGLLVTMIVIGILSSIGAFALEENIWGIILVISSIGLFALRKIL